MASIETILMVQEELIKQEKTMFFGDDPVVIVYGIKNCDSCRKALAWLEAEGIAHRFHDFRKDGLEPAKVAGWVEAVDLEILINRRGTTYRRLPETQRQFGKDAATVSVLTAQPTLMKRPIFETNEGVKVGFKPPVQEILRKISAATG